MMTSSIFAANEPALGYLYQIRYGLMLAVTESNEDAKLLIERIDDISIDSSQSLDVYQTKFHLKSIANLTNASSDLWKTIRVWCEGIHNGTLDINNCVFNLITTAKASEGSIPFQLKQNTHSERDVDKICNELMSVANNSANTTTNLKGYDAFKKLSKDQQQKFISKITIIDSSIDLTEAKDKILDRLKLSTLKIESLYERLEGWFLGEVISQLLNQRDEISVREIRLKILDVADTLKIDNLPNDFNKSIKNEDELSNYNSYTFVKQLSLIDANQRMINIAISDYYRAFSQKSKWIREGLIKANDEIEYHDKLREDWDRKFSIVSDVSASDEENKKKGRAFYEAHYVNQFPRIFIKDRFQESYMVTGCCHELSDKKDIGWHPDFENQV